MNTASATASSPTESPKVRQGNQPNRSRNNPRRDIEFAKVCHEQGLALRITEGMLPSGPRNVVKTMLGMEVNHDLNCSKVSGSSIPNEAIMEQMMGRFNDSSVKNPLSQVLFAAVQAGKIGKETVMSSLILAIEKKFDLPALFLIETVFVDRDKERSNNGEKGFNFLSEVAFALCESGLKWLVAIGANLTFTNSFGETIPDIIVSGLKNALKKGIRPDMARGKFLKCFEYIERRVNLLKENGADIDIVIPNYMDIATSLAPAKKAPVKKALVKSEPKKNTAKKTGKTVKKESPLPASAFSALSMDSDSEDDSKMPDPEKSVSVEAVLDDDRKMPDPVETEQDEKVVSDDWIPTKVKKGKAKPKKNATVDVVDFKNDGPYDESGIDKLLIEFHKLEKINEAEAFIFIHEELKAFPKDLRTLAFARIEDIREQEMSRVE